MRPPFYSELDACDVGGIVGGEECHRRSDFLGFVEALRRDLLQQSPVWLSPHSRRGHDRATAFEALEQALAISPSSSFALFCGSMALAYAGEAERGIDWAERALRISPFDRMSPLSYHALAISHFLRGRYDEAAHAARRAVQSIPSSSASRSVLAAALAKLGRIEEAKAVALQVLALDPSFSAARFCAATGLPTLLAEPMTDAWTTAGLPP